MYAYSHTHLFGFLAVVWHSHTHTHTVAKKKGVLTPEASGTPTASSSSIGQQQEGKPLPEASIDEVLRGEDILALRVREEDLSKVRYDVITIALYGDLWDWWCNGKQSIHPDLQILCIHGLLALTNAFSSSLSPWESRLVTEVLLNTV